MKKLSLLLLLFLLVGCNNTKIDVLNPPSNIKFDEATKTVSWDIITDAFSYVLSINNETHNLNTNSFVVDLPSGNYEIKVRAVYAEGESRYTVPIFVDIIKNEVFNYQIGDDLTFDDIEGATSYRLVAYNIFLIEKVFDEVITSPFDLSYFTLMGNTRFELYAYYQTNVIADEIFFINFQSATYTKDTLDLSISLGEPVVDLYLNQNLVSKDDYTQTSTELVISSGYLDTLVDDTYVLNLKGSYNAYIYLLVTSFERPVLVSSSNVTYDDADLSFTFDLKGGIFEGLAANPGLDETDYGFNIDTLVISKAYIDSVILADSNRSRIIFSYVISNGPYTVIGYITVNLTN